MVDRATRELIRLDRVSVRYRVSAGHFATRKVTIEGISDVSLIVVQGESVGIVGETGSGKSTVAKLVMGMVKPSDGTVTVGDRNVGTRTPEGEGLLTQVVLQDPYSSLNPRMRIDSIITEPLKSGRGKRMTRNAMSERVEELLALVGLPSSHRALFPHQLSGGQRQRVAIARALAPSPALVVLDEPTSALDVSIRAQILNLLRRLQAELGVTYLVVSHDLLTVSYLAATVAVMHRGRVVEIGPTGTLYGSPRHPATLELLSSAPGGSKEFLNLARPEPTAEVPAAACRYARRCPLRLRLGNPPICESSDLTLAHEKGSHQSACHFPAEVEYLAREMSTG